MITLKENELDGKKIGYSSETEFLVQVGRYRGAYKTRYAIKGDLPRAVFHYNAINIGNGYKKRLVMPSAAKKPVLAKMISNSRSPGEGKGTRRKAERTFPVGTKIVMTMGGKDKGEIIPRFRWQDSTDGTYDAPGANYVPVQWENGTKGYVCTLHIAKVTS